MPVAAEDRLLEIDAIDRELDFLFPTAVTITRTSDEDFQSRQLVVSLDGARIAELLWGDSITCEVAPGRHTLRVHNTLVWKTVEFHARPGEQVFFEAINKATASTFLLLPLFGISPLYVSLRRLF